MNGNVNLITVRERNTRHDQRSILPGYPDIQGFGLLKYKKLILPMGEQCAEVLWEPYEVSHLNILHP